MTEPRTMLAAHTPIFEIGGREQPELARDLLRLEIEEDTDGLRRLVARFVALGPRGAEQHEQLYLDRALLDFGARIDVALGPPDGRRTLFEGAISGIEADFTEGQDPEVVIFAEDALMSLRMTRRMRTYRQVSDGDVARQIAAAHGLEADVAADGPTYDVVQQWNQSDLAFLRDRALRLGAEVWIEGRSLKLKTRDHRRPTQVTLVRGNQLIEAQLRADLAHQRTAVKVSGYDAGARAVIDEEAGDAVIRAEVSGGRTGPSILATAFGERISYRVDQVPLADAEARDWAAAEMRRRARAFVTVTGTTDGTPDLVVGSELTLQAVGAIFEGGGYYVTRVRHSFDLRGEGHRTRFEAQRATISEAR